jgi:hypothetical protein
MSPVKTAAPSQQQQDPLIDSTSSLPKSSSKPSSKSSSQPSNQSANSAGESKEVWWINGAFVAYTHVVALVAMLLYTPKWQSLVLMAVNIQLATMG